MNGITRRQLVVGMGMLCLARVVWSAPYKTPTQTNDTWRNEWHDAKRNRNVPVKIYFPKAAGPFPVIIFSHGLGGTRDNYEYLGNYWSQHGYVSVHLQHVGSDDAVWRGGGGMQAMRTAMTGQNSLLRARDVSFAIDQLQLLNADPKWPLHGKLDLAHIGMAGHSFGANTTLIVSGLKMPLIEEALTDPRIKCAIAMSSPAPRLKNYGVIYGDIKVPMLHMTGTEDTILGEGTNATDRRLPYDHIQGTDSYLLTFAGGDHMVFSGRRRPIGPLASDDRNHALILQSSIAFWNAYLQDDAKALSWLRSDFSKELATNGVFEQKVSKANL